MKLFRQGQQALKDKDTAKALDFFKQAHDMRDQLDPSTQQRLQDYLQMVAAPASAKPPVAKNESTMIDSTASQKQLVAKQLLAELAQKEVAAGKARAKDPKRAIELLKEARASVESAALAEEDRNQLLRRVDRKLADLDKYILDNKADLELEATNREVLKEVERRRENKLEVDDKLAKLVDDYNNLMDQGRYAEAEVMAKRAARAGPGEPGRQADLLDAAADDADQPHRQVEGRQGKGFLGSPAERRRSRDSHGRPPAHPVPGYQGLEAVDRFASARELRISVRAAPSASWTSRRSCAPRSRSSFTTARYRRSSTTCRSSRQ